MVLRRLVLLFFFLRFSIFTLIAQESEPIRDLPLQYSDSHGSNSTLVIYVTGDGGWNSFNQSLVQELASRGYGVVALNSRKYFWSEKTPENFATDIETLTGYYLKEGKKSSVIIIGYSFGADVVSFLPSRISPVLLRLITKIVLISPSSSTDFVIRISDLVGDGENLNRKYKVAPEIEAVVLPVICTFGMDEAKALKDGLKNKTNHTLIKLPGDHRYNNDFRAIIKQVETH